ncbi:MAG: VOC family protein, partial [Vicinamibacteria bacterium]
FGAKEKVRMPGPDGKIMHAEIQIGDSRVMLGDEMPEMGAMSPASLGGSAGSIFLYVKNVDAFAEKAIAAGATVVMPLQDMFWGDRYGKLQDPYGHQWQIGTHKEDLTPKQMAKRTQEAMAGM